MIFEILKVAVPVRGAGCIQNVESKSKSLSGVAVPVRGTGCIVAHKLHILLRSVVVPVRGAGCIITFQDLESTTEYAGLLSP